VIVALPARAKLNLDLSVLRRLPDGMHELRSHVQAIELHDLLEVAPATKTELNITGFEVAKGDDNSVLKAQAALEAAAGRALPAAFTLHKRIPPGSGLGGASSDAAAALRALAALYNLKQDLQPIASQVGADVTFFLDGGGALVEGVGERVTLIPSAAAWYAIAWPEIELSTAEVYRAWDEVKGEGPNDLRRAAARVEPKLEEFAASLGPHWQMTGSGSAFFCRCPDRDSAMEAVTNLACWTTVSGAV